MNKSCSNHRKKRKVLKLKTSDVLWSVTDFCWTFAKKTRNVIVITRFGQKSGHVLKTKFNVKICTYYLFADGKEQELRLSCYPISWMNGQNSRVVVHHFSLGYMIFILRLGLELTEVVHWWLAIFLINSCPIRVAIKIGTTFQTLFGPFHKLQFCFIQILNSKCVMPKGQIMTWFYLLGLWQKLCYFISITKFNEQDSSLN